VGTRRIINKNYHPVKDPVRAFYLAVRRLSKTLIKRAVIISNFSEREKLVLITVKNNPSLKILIERVLNNLIIPSH
jgi:hypothetical protein